MSVVDRVLFKLGGRLGSLSHLENRFALRELALRMPKRFRLIFHIRLVTVSIVRLVSFHYAGILDTSRNVVAKLSICCMVLV